MALRPGTPVESLFPYGQRLHSVTVMTVEPGFGGQELKKEPLKKILELNRMEQQVHNSYVAVNDWYEMIREAKMVSMQPVHPVCIKYQPPRSLHIWIRNFPIITGMLSLIYPGQTI